VRNGVGTSIGAISRSARAALGVVLLLAACAAQPSATASPAASVSQPTPTPSPSQLPPCPNPGGGGACLGPLAAGTYSTTVFEVPITYTVPDGWANLEDLPGNFLLIPPGGSLQGVDAGTSDYMGIYVSIAATSGDCDGPQAGQEALGVGRTPSAIAAELATHPGVHATTPVPVTVGGLSGIVFDLTIPVSYSTVCAFLEAPGALLIHGVPPSSFDHGMFPGLTMRLYLLEHAGGTLAIEVDDVSGGMHLDAYSAIVNRIRFRE
jgi:hypothetical protein